MGARATNVLAGVWLLLAPAVLGYAGVARTNDFWVGLAVILFALLSVAYGELRYVNTGLGLWLLLAPFVLGYTHAGATANDVLLGIVVFVVSLVPNVRMVRGRGPVTS